MSLQDERFAVIHKDYDEQGFLPDHDDHRWLIEKLTVAWAEVKRLREENTVLRERSCGTVTADFAQNPYDNIR